MENFFNHLKTECIYMHQLETAEEMKQSRFAIHRILQQ
ncbi:IS3 family transposase [Parageobacillus thermoglucosidasius]